MPICLFSNRYIYFPEIDFPYFGWFEWKTSAKKIDSLIAKVPWYLDRDSPITLNPRVVSDWRFLEVIWAMPERNRFFYVRCSLTLAGSDGDSDGMVFKHTHTNNRGNLFACLSACILVSLLLTVPNAVHCIVHRCICVQHRIGQINLEIGMRSLTRPRVMVALILVL